jgi:putative oxidoreductase
MAHVEPSRGSGVSGAGSVGFDWELAFLGRFAAPVLLLARVMLAYIFVLEGLGKISGYSGVAGYMEQHGVSSALLPLVILTELGGGLLVLFGFATRWAAIALAGFCLLTGLFFHLSADQAVQLQKNIAMAGGFLALATAGPGLWSIDGWRARDR